MSNEVRSSLMFLSQVDCGRPGGLLQSSGFYPPPHPGICPNSEKTSSLEVKEENQDGTNLAYKVACFTDVVGQPRLACKMAVKRRWWGLIYFIYCIFGRLTFTMLHL